MIKRISLSLIAVFVVAGVALAAGLWANFPIVGGASYSCGSVNAVSNCTVAAGPVRLTGNETIPADTNLSSGQTPQTVLLKPAVLGAGPHQYAASLNGDTVTLTGLQRRLIIEPAGTIAGLTVVFPAASTLVDNQLLGICTTQIITSLTLTAGSGTTILNGPTALLVPVTTGGASCVEWVYRLTNTSWYRVQ